MTSLQKCEFCSAYRLLPGDGPHVPHYRQRDGVMVLQDCVGRILCESCGEAVDDCDCVPTATREEP